MTRRSARLASTPRLVLAGVAASLTLGLAAGAGASSRAPAMAAPMAAAGSGAATTAAPDELPAYAYTVAPIDATLAERMRSSWRPGCPVPLADLRYLRMSHYGFDGRAHTGEMVVHRDQVWKVTSVFARLYDLRFPIERMRLVDDYEGDDAAAARANNTFAFSCRRAKRAGHPRSPGRSWSVHSYGRALDVNPVQNPHVEGSTVQPAGGRAYLDRWPARLGMVDWRVRAAFAEAGWSWGGGWASRKSYQHFERTRG